MFNIFKKKVTSGKGAPKYGWKPDMPDHRDIPFSAKFKVAATFPRYIDLRPHDSPIEDQGNLGSCTAHAIAGALQMLEHIDKVPYANLSRLFIYYNERVIENSVKYDSGAMLRDGIKTLTKQGVSIENYWLYSDNSTKFKIKPPTKAYTSGLQHVVTQYQRLTTLNDMLTCLSNGYPFVFGFSVYESFESVAVEQTGIVPMPGPTEQLLGGHAVCAVGYNLGYKRLLVRNSWGPNWGIKGYFTIPFDYVTNTNLADDFWTMQRGTKM